MSDELIESVPKLKNEVYATKALRHEDSSYYPAPDGPEIPQSLRSPGMTSACISMGSGAGRKNDLLPLSCS